MILSIIVINYSYNLWLSQKNLIISNVLCILIISFLLVYCMLLWKDGERAALVVFRTYLLDQKLWIIVIKKMMTPMMN